MPDDPLHIDQEKGPLGDPVLGQGGIAGDSPPYCRVTCISGKSLRGVRQLERLANVFCEKGWFVLIPRIWTFSSWNLG